MPLYIPHGSDNTKRNENDIYDTKNFISHMVQIIRRKVVRGKATDEIFISHMVQIIHYVIHNENQK